MRQIVSDPQFAEFFLDWINEKIGTTFKPINSKYVAMVNDKEEVLCVIVVDKFQKYHCEISLASNGSKRWATKEFLKAAYEIAFSSPSVARINFVIEVENQDAIKLHEALGHPREGLLKNWFGEGKDAYLHRLTRQEYNESKWSK